MIDRKTLDSITKDLKKFKTTKIDKKELSSAQIETLLWNLKNRFEKNTNRHKGVDWATVQEKLKGAKSAQKLSSLHEMEKTGVEPDVVGFDKETDEIIFFDCSLESPKGCLLRSRGIGVKEGTSTENHRVGYGG